MKCPFKLIYTFLENKIPFKITFNWSAVLCFVKRSADFVIPSYACTPKLRKELRWLIYIKKKWEIVTLKRTMIAFTTFCKTLRADRFGSVQFDA